MTDREIMQQALQALEEMGGGYSQNLIAALRERLAQPQRTHWEGCEEVHPECKQPEPVIDKSAAIRIATALGWEPRREWQGLTVAQIEEAFQQSAGADEDTHIRFARAIEAKLKEKHT